MKANELLKGLCPPILWHTAKMLTPPLAVRGIKRIYALIKKASQNKKEKKCLSELLEDTRLYATLNDGLLRIRITNKCNAKCRYCGIQGWPEAVQKLDMRSEVLYEYCKPLYEQIKILLLTGGDPLITKESMPFCTFISENYPQVTLCLETNGIGFTEKWQQLAIKNLMKVHVSVNASNEDIYNKGCWEGDAGKKAYQKLTQNIRDYMTLLRENGLEAFAPDVSMVVNKDTADDIRAFVKYALTERLYNCTFFFDYTESDMAGNYFGEPETSRPALYELMKLERVLARKFFIYFRLWIPLKETEMMQRKVDAIPLNELQKEYADILELAKGRSMKAEYETRQTIRKTKGKKDFSFDEDWTPTIRQTRVQDKVTCFAPFNSLDIYPNQKFECCGWINPRFDLNEAINNGAVDWEKEYNNAEMRKLRKDMLNDCYTLCQKCCPLNPEYNEVCSSHKYGYDRKETSN
jgi:MoaA/NifB/PqqE/SkfB family radical SAM enzyme